VNNKKVKQYYNEDIFIILNKFINLRC